MNKYVLLAIIPIVAVSAVLVFFDEPKVTSYTECVDAGFDVMESFPEKCVTDDGTVFENSNPCRDGYVLVGDICDEMTNYTQEELDSLMARSDCERAVDSREAAGVEQDYQAELAKCRQ